MAQNYKVDYKKAEYLDFTNLGVRFFMHDISGILKNVIMEYFH